MTNVSLDEFRKGLEQERKRRKIMREREYANYRRWSWNRTVKQRKGER